MVEYIKQLIRKMKQENNLSSAYLTPVRKELERLDPRDFEPQVQHDVLCAPALDQSRSLWLS